ncbi:MAG: hypothetical protein L7S44_05135 [Flavobacteriaceae bacterium]|nr:hypothetical protein [Flavobacteriaceae bacterium]
MGVAILTKSVRDVYWKQTNEYNFKINNNEYRVRVAEDSNGCEELWWNDDNWQTDGWPDEVQQFFDLVSYGGVDTYANEGEEFDLDEVGE